MRKFANIAEVERVILYPKMGLIIALDVLTVLFAGIVFLFGGLTYGAMNCAEALANKRKQLTKEERSPEERTLS